MRYLLDTNVISQLMKERPHPGIHEWVLKQNEFGLFLSVVTLMEIRVGIENKPPGRKRQELEDWLIKDLSRRFQDRIIPIEEHVADLAGRIIHRSSRQRTGTDEMDALIAATAMVNDMALATLNRKHFAHLGLELVDF